MVGSAPPPPARGPPPALRKPDVSYIASADLPSSEEEEEERTKVVREVKGITLERSGKEEQKARKKDMLMAQRLAAMKEAAVQDDTDAFTVRLAKATDEAGNVALAHSRDIKVDGLSVSARGKVLLENTSFVIVAGRRYGLVGPNGKGKSTLLKLLGWRKIPVPEYIDVLMVEQEVVGDDTPALAAVVAADGELMALRGEEKALRATLDDAAAAEEGGAGAHEGAPPDTDAASARLAAVYERLAEMGAGGAEARAAKILAGLGFTEAMQGRPTHSFSGGWRMRISLARALYIQPTLLLLDGAGCAAFRRASAPCLFYFLLSSAQSPPTTWI